MGGILFTSNPFDTRFVATPSCQRIMEDFVEGGWMHRNTRMQRLFQSNLHGFVTEADFFTEEDLARDPLYTEFFWPRGVGWGTGTLIRVPTGDLLMFHLERWRKDGCFEPEVVATLDSLRPHLARAALLSARLSDERARGAVTSLEAIGMPAAVISANGRVIAANTLLEGTGRYGPPPSTGSGCPPLPPTACWPRPSRRCSSAMPRRAGRSRSLPPTRNRPASSMSCP